MKKPVRVTIEWIKKENWYRVARIHPDGSLGMHVFHWLFKDALKAAAYYASFGDVE